MYNEPNNSPISNLTQTAVAYNSIVSEQKVEDSTSFSNETPQGSKIPGVHELAHNIAGASENGTLFFLAVEVGLLLDDYFKKSGLPPTPIDLETMIAQAAKAMVGE